jgi:regulator of replication initiation timing
MTSFKWSGIGAQAAADKTSLKTQLYDLAAENSGLKAKADELADEIARLKAESSEAQERAKKSRLDAESREKDLHQRLQTSLDALRGESSISLDWVFSCRLIVSLN